MERCRGDATLAERRAMTAKPIAGAGGWTLFDRTPDGPPCVARLAGGQIDTELMPDERPGVFVLGARRPGWASWGHAIRIGLSIDGAKPSRMTAWSLLNGVLLRMAGPARPERLRGASTLDWTLPTGRFHADVTGIGAAFDAVKACRQRHARRRAR
jgi:hypothetical protein